MPLIDDETRVTDRRSTARWPWILVVAGLCVLWMMVAALVSFGPRFFAARASGTPPAATVATQTYISQQLQQAQQFQSYGSTQQVAAAIQAIPPDTPMTAIDKHQYFRLGGDSLTGSGSPLAGSRYYERFLSLSVHLYESECQGCHAAPSGVNPVKVAEMLASKLGTQYASALAAAGKLSSTRNTLK